MVQGREDRDEARFHRRVVVGYNGRGHGRQALLWAAGEAERCDLPLSVLYAANFPGMTLPPGPGLLEREAGAIEASEEVTERGLDEVRAAFPGVRVEGATEVTSPPKALIHAGESAEMVVLGTRGLGQMAGALLGSVAFAVAARAPCPVVVVKEEPLQGPAGPDRPVVVGTDGSSHAQAATTFAADRAASLGAELVVVTATGEHPDAISGQHLRETATRIAQSTVEDLARTHAGLTVTSLVEDAAPARALVATSADAGMVVVGTRGRGAFTGMWLGSVSHAVIHGARCPVAVVGDDPDA